MDAKVKKLAVTLTRRYSNGC